MADFAATGGVEFLIFLAAVFVAEAFALVSFLVEAVDLTGAFAAIAPAFGSAFVLLALGVTLALALSANGLAKALAAQIEATEALLTENGSADALAVARRLKSAREAFVDVVNFVATHTRSNPNAVFAGSVPYLMLAGNLMAGWQLARALLLAQDELSKGVDVAFMKAKIITARFYADHLLTKAPGLRDSIVEGSESVNALALESF